MDTITLNIQVASDAAQFSARIDELHADLVSDLIAVDEHLEGFNDPAMKQTKLRIEKVLDYLDKADRVLTRIKTTVSR